MKKTYCKLSLDKDAIVYEANINFNKTMEEDAVYLDLVSVEKNKIDGNSLFFLGTPIKWNNPNLFYCDRFGKTKEVK